MTLIELFKLSFNSQQKFLNKGVYYLIITLKS
jgi:hypothetical protein